MAGIDLSQTAYVTPGGQVVYLAPRTATGSLPTLKVSADVQGSIANVSLSATDTTGYQLADTRWTATPTPASWAKQVMSGPSAAFRASAGATTLKAFVPSNEGEKTITVIVPNSSTNTVQDLWKQTFTRGDETLKVETSFWFGSAYSQVPTRLVRLASPGVASERVVVAERVVDYPANTGVILSESITFPASVAAGKAGVGYEYQWEADLPDNIKVTSRTLPMWVIGDVASAAPPKVSDTPAPANRGYPEIFTRPASAIPQITPAAGKTYQQYVDRIVEISKTTGIKGPNLSILQYGTVIYYVDLDSTTVPKYRIKHWDIWGWGKELAGWYGVDNSKSPPRSYVAVDVPIPDSAMPTIGTDRSCTIVGMRGGKVDTIWELWCMIKHPDGTVEAASVGKTNAADQWRHSDSYTVASAGLSAYGYALLIDDMEKAVAYVKAERAAGRVPSEDVICSMSPHRMSMNLPNPGAPGFSYPATHTDGTDYNELTPKEGDIISLKQTFDVAAGNYYPLTHVRYVLGKRYGWFITDRTNYSTTQIVEMDTTYGPMRARWDKIVTSGETWDLALPPDQVVVHKRYASKAEWDGDAPVNPNNGGSGQQALASGLPFKLGFFGHDPARLKRAESVIGRTADFAQMSPQRSTSGWQKPAGSPPETPNGVFDSTWWLTSHGAEKSLELSMPLWHADAGETLANAASGAYDAQWERFGKLVHDARPGSVIRIGWEMNLAGWAWAPKAGQEAQWKDAYRHASTAVKKGGPSLLVSFVPNIGVGDTGVRPDAVYPGDAYVDLVGFDAYDWWPPYTSDSAWAQHRDADMSWAWWLDFAKTHGKKVVIPEIGLSNGVGNTNDGDDNPLFFRYVMPWLLARKDQLWGLSYFDENADYIRNSIGDGQVPLGAAEFKKQLDIAAAS